MVYKIVEKILALIDSNMLLHYHIRPQKKRKKISKWRSSWLWPFKTEINIMDRILDFTHKSFGLYD